MTAPPPWLPVLLAALATVVFVIGNHRAGSLIGRSPDVFRQTPGTALAFLGRAHRLAFVGTALGVMLAWAMPTSIFALPTAVGWLGNLTMLLGCGIMAAAQHAMGASWRVGIDTAPTDLVVRGPFRLSRNPTFVGMFLLLLGALLATPGLLTAAGLAAAAVSFPTQVRMEEEHLIALHGDAYRAYADRAPRWVGWLQEKQDSVS